MHSVIQALQFTLIQKDIKLITSMALEKLQKWLDNHNSDRYPPLSYNEFSVIISNALSGVVSSPTSGRIWTMYADYSSFLTEGVSGYRTLLPHVLLASGFDERPNNKTPTYTIQTLNRAIQYACARLLHLPNEESMDYVLAPIAFAAAAMAASHKEATTASKLTLQSHKNDATSGNSTSKRMTRAKSTVKLADD